jgi:phytoene dehydrogenase-like protein
LDSPLLSPDGTKYDRMEVHVYNYDPTLAPAGKTVVSVNLYTQSGDYWITLRAKDQESYNMTKGNFAKKILEILEKKIAGIRGNIEQVDIATPATFHRYTNNRKGSIQGWLPGKNLIAPSPVQIRLPGLKNFYFVGHWTIPGGGLPVAIKTARDVSMRICHESKRKFEIH